jgi:predicted AAA+ superfamily ATPase
MRLYQRTLHQIIQKKMGHGKAIIISGPRQVGKTTLIKNLLGEKAHLFLDCDDPVTRRLLDKPSTAELRSLLGKHKIVFIDEAQRINSIGLTMKIITDQFKEVQLIATGSSSFELGNRLNEPLTGRKWEYTLLPISWEELEERDGYLNSEQQLENRIRFGMYPDVLNHPGDEIDILRQLVNSYLFRDIQALSDIRKPEVLDKLVQALALQIGNEVNYNELAQLIGVDKNTIASYIDIMEKGYIIFKLTAFSRNIRNEIKKNRKIYFYDTGVRNMVIGNFDPLDSRVDKGMLWENFLIAERFKQNVYKKQLVRMHFWRTTQQQEVDLVEVGRRHGCRLRI